ncbi:hypothetical protein PFDSM3638_06040 [Pyrococcus furiosus DSM 3638]|uniref:CopG family transcriptional regulator n=3 Tax=Pyrococcus furiosus TaxID=2261 RepID=Q8U1J9_PYRFU|nr:MULTISPECIES: hypothetical protein [Pyrococcus]AAL81331.1 hypothetical protein PF1207 [Pyrococcus furiosus DSM 3638]AFN03996.1 hypothetical protein PFC_05245 [Pyrococcus furiosus COM1]MDK2870450.1 hypothetical protein [Pyrococcus sp.]QEK78858.1 hypothetical protein PFDSM3638_06040 [Pyrococcus furiosus DSM 3638]
MKTIAVDEETWEAIKKLKARLDAKSYDEVLKKLIQAWHTLELETKAESISLEDDEAELVLSVIRDRSKLVEEGSRK